MTPWTIVPARLLCPWDFPGKNTGVGTHVPLQEIFPTQGSTPCLQHWQADCLPLSHLGNTSYLIIVHKLTLTFKGHRSPQQHKHREAGAGGAPGFTLGTKHTRSTPSGILDLSNFNVSWFPFIFLDNNIRKWPFCWYMTFLRTSATFWNMPH